MYYSLNSKIKMQSSKSQFKIKNYAALIFLLSVSLALPLIGQATELYLETSKNEYYTQDTFIIDIRIDVKHDERINAIEGYLKFPNNILRVKDFSTGNSVLTFIEKPEIDNEKGLISFTGIIPGGYSGRILGDPGKSNLLGTIIFSTISQGSAKIVFQNNSLALLNDGKGTPAQLATKGVILDIKTPVGVKFLEDEWQEELEKDKISPEDFSPEIVKIDGKYYLVFITKDKNSGIDHYEILEKDFSKIISRLFWKQNWIKVSSPYLLKNQLLSSKIEVKAVDKAGNERVVVVEPRYSAKMYEFWQIWFILIIISITYVIWRIIVKQKQNNTKSKRRIF